MCVNYILTTSRDLIMESIWKIYNPNLRLQELLSRELGVSPVLAQLLVNRSIKTPREAQEFLFGSLADCHDPYLMKDMDRGVDRVIKAVERREKILIYGDYDVDGVTSAALLAEVFDEIGARYEVFIPNRVEEGYGMNLRAVALARDKDVKLIVTVDCGINSVKEVKCARDYGIDVVITDHHEVKPGEVPDAYAVIDPHQPDCAYPFKYLAGVGVAYKFAQAIVKKTGGMAEEYLDLVALGTVADVVPLSGENRILAKEGLKRLREARRPGLKALMEIARVSPETLTARHIGFALGPRINAIGRIGSANVAFDLLRCKDFTEALEIAQRLDKENRNRQDIEKDILKQALEMAKDTISVGKDKVIVLAHESWHPGVVGIVASRLTEEFYKPAILIALDGENGKGSGRGIEGFDLFKAVNRSSRHLVDFGGHESACGIKIKLENINAFRDEINETAGLFFSEDKRSAPEIMIDLQLPFAHIGAKLIKEMELLMPYGSENAEPFFLTNGIKVKNTPRDIGKNGFKFLGVCGGLTCEVLTFRKNTVIKPKQGNMIDLVHTPSINSWDGIDSIQLNIKALRVVD